MSRSEKTISESVQAEIIRAFLGPEGHEGTGCPVCGELLGFEFFGESRLAVRVTCQSCTLRFSWEQPVDSSRFDHLHINYFLERVRVGEKMRCPVDDCLVTYTEFSDKVFEFRCPYCNRRGRGTQPRPPDHILPILTED